MSHKTCPRCNQTKPIDEFSKNKARKDGLATGCKSCKKEQQAKWYKTHSNSHKANVKSRTKTYLVDTTTRLMAYLETHPCVDCNETNPLVLDFDHVRGKKVDAVTRLIQTNRVSWDTLLTEIEKCVVRCSNCHRKKTAKERNTIRFQLWSRNLVVKKSDA